MYFSFFLFLNDTATTEIYSLSLHDALPICGGVNHFDAATAQGLFQIAQLLDLARTQKFSIIVRSEEHTSELQSHLNIVCRLLLEQKKNTVHIKIRCNATSAEACYPTCRSTI